jgi:hypothetical protein
MLRLTLLVGLLALLHLGTVQAVEWPLAATQVAAEESEEVEGATPADRSPLEDLNPAESSWQVWIGPILLGLFAIALVFLIRRFSMGGKNGPRRDQGGD